jgi:Protein of unknown function (DUF2809)
MIDATGLIPDATGRIRAANVNRPRRNPLIQLSLMALAAVLGIGSRRYAHILPRFIAAYAGDTLWALAAYLGFGLILTRASAGAIALIALTFAVAIEVSQLYHAPWIDSLRRTMLGGLLLGYGFLWSDLVCYVAGVGLGVAIDHTVNAFHKEKE